MIDEKKLINFIEEREEAAWNNMDDNEQIVSEEQAIIDTYFLIRRKIEELMEVKDNG